MESNWFKQRREERGLSQSEVVHEFYKLGKTITVGAVSGWERGQVPSIDFVDAIASVYQVTTSKILAVMHEMAKARTQAKQPAAAD